MLNGVNCNTIIHVEIVFIVVAVVVIFPFLGPGSRALVSVSKVLKSFNAIESFGFQGFPGIRISMFSN